MLKVKGFDWGRVRILTEKQAENLERKGVVFQTGAAALGRLNPETEPIKTNPEVTAMVKNTVRIVLIALGFIVLCLAYYCLFPKYEMFNIANEDETACFRLNRITERVDIRQPQKEPTQIFKGRLF